MKPAQAFEKVRAFFMEYNKDEVKFDLKIFPFTHALRRSCRVLPRIKDMTFECSPEARTFTAYVVYSTGSVRCVYNCDSEKVIISDNQRSSECTTEDFEKVLFDYQPKIKAVIKKIKKD